MSLNKALRSTVRQAGHHLGRQEGSTASLGIRGGVPPFLGSEHLLGARKRLPTLKHQNTSMAMGLATLAGKEATEAVADS